jgi:zinc protease
VNFRIILAMFFLLAAPCTRADPSTPLRRTLPNGLRVVVLHNALAPVVTVEMNFLVGGNETPAGFPGMAHAQEHMAFRGCDGMSADQTAAVYAQLGGQNNADTQQNITQYFATVPAADLDVALEAQAACLRGIDDSQDQWAQERGAIEQEVARDLSNPTYKFIDRLNKDLFEDTPYAHDPLGTKDSFDATTAQMLRAFHEKWYSPGDAILVIVGDIDTASTMDKVEKLFGAVPARAVPPRPAVHLKNVKSESFTLESNLPYALGFIAYRLPGTAAADYAAVQILADVLSSQRADLYAMVPAGEALAAEFGLAENYPKASVGYGLVALPAGADASRAIRDMRRILTHYATHGVPAELVAAAKRSEIAAAEFERNSIPGLANLWSNSVAAEGRTSPDDDVDAIKGVSVDEVNRAARHYLSETNSITATLIPVPTGQPVATKGFGGAEQVTTAPAKPVKLPAWAESNLAQLTIPDSHIQVVDTTLPNGIRLIVKTDTISPTVSLLGAVEHNAELQTPPGKEGVADLLSGLFPYGTQTLDRLALQKALDDIAANETAGYTFSLAVLKENFARGVQLLADNELRPALPGQVFPVFKQRTAQFIAGNRDSPEYRTTRALDLALLPAADPALREATPATLDHVTLEDVKRYHAATLRPDLTTIVVIGDISPEEARSIIERWFGDWRAAGPKPATTLPPVPPNKAAAINVADPEAQQDSVVLAEQLTINRFDPDYYALQLGNHVLGGGFYATRLYHDVRQVAGYVYTVDVGLNTSKTRASYTVNYGCDPDNVLNARNLIQRDLEQMRTQNVSVDELHQAKALLLRQIPLSESSQDAVARGLLARAQLGLPLDEPNRAAEKYYALGAAEVRAAFARQLRPDDFVQVVRGPTPR